MTQAILDKAVRIYYKHAYERPPGQFDRIDLSVVSRDLEEQGCSDLRLCCGKTGSNMKLMMTMLNGSLYFSVYSNSYGLSGSAKKLNEEISDSIEDEWKRSGIPVYPKS